MLPFVAIGLFALLLGGVIYAFTLFVRDSARRPPRP
jgi:hypothetical protein